jgi:transglutaminase-like putative cysteine protease
MSSMWSGQARLAVLAWATTLACALAFSPLLQGSGYLVAAAIVTAAPTLAGIGLRAARLPAWIVLVGQLVALVMWLTAIYADGAVLGLIPTPEAAESFRTLLESGLEAARVEPPPAPASRGLVLVVTLGIAGCHLLVDMFAATLHRVPLTGLPLLALYTVPAAIAADGVPTLAFVAAATGFVMLLASDERTRLGHWGRQLAHGQGAAAIKAQSRVTSSALNAAAQRVGFLAIALAAAVPLLLPDLPEGLLGGGAGSGPGSGGTVHISNPIVDLRRDLRELSTDPAMTVYTAGPTPEYFRLVVLDSFDGDRWEFSPRRLNASLAVDEQLSSPPGLDTSVAARTQSFGVDVVQTFRSEWLPAPYAPTRVTAAGDWRYNPDSLDIVASEEGLDTAGLSYRVTSLLSDPSTEDLAESTGTPARILNAYTGLPDDLPDEVKDLTEEITGTASRYEKAVLLQRWFREPGRFEYTLEAPSGHSDNDLVSFLTVERRGYCEQFAAAMAVMARYAGIPARVAVGFLRPTRVEEGVYQYTFADLHAWPELYFEGAGWVRFEPTPAARDGAVAPSYSTGDFEEEPVEPSPSPTETSDPTASPSLPDRQPDPGTAAGGGGQGGPWGTGIAVTVAVLVLVAALPGLLRIALRRRRWARAGDARERAEAAWSEVRDTSLDLRQHWPATTPRRTGALVQQRVAGSEAAVEAVRRVALAVERARFARSVGDSDSLREDAETICQALRETESRVDQLTARVLPRSLRANYRRWRAERPVSSQTRDDDASVLPSAP